MTIADVYSRYQIMPSLQQHMYRVTAVSLMVSSHLKKSLDPVMVMKACLLHDMGNILKFNFDLFPEFLEPEGKEYWQHVKDMMEKKYGPDEHEATLKIVKELAMSDRIYELVDIFSFSKAKEIFESGDIERMICSYSDMRVAPHGVVSLVDRLADGRKRFKVNKQRYDREELFAEMTGYLGKIEVHLFSQSDIVPEKITNESVEPLMLQLSTVSL